MDLGYPPDKTYSTIKSPPSLRYIYELYNELGTIKVCVVCNRITGHEPSLYHWTR